MFRLCVRAAIPIMVHMQEANAVATRSVGENRSPLPWLSTGASVSITVPDWRWVATVLNSPSYVTFDVTGVNLNVKLSDLDAEIHLFRVFVTLISLVWGM